MNRTKVAEWWELWWIKPGEPRVKVLDGDYGEQANERIPYHSFLTLDAARNRLKFNKYYRVIHVVRYVTRVQNEDHRRRRGVL